MQRLRHGWNVNRNFQVQYRQQVELEAVSPNGMNWIHYNILEYIQPLPMVELSVRIHKLINGLRMMQTTSFK